ncbi:MAG: hypothetical protein E7034_00810 [Akkermansiaceae bacterium]|nr:hypothetical protein [Akkermansiaceae bacterium]
MKKLVHIFLCLLALFAVFMPSSAQDATTEPRVIRGSKVVLIFKNLPTGEAANVDGEYQVSRSDGTILLPFLESRLSVLGKTARQVEDMVRSQYIAQKIYTDPIVIARVGHKGEDLEARFVQVTGYVHAKKNLPYREGITLIQALIECGDISDHGSRKIQITRGTVTRTYDYFSARDRAIKLMPNDVIFVPRRPPFEGRPRTVGP